jgi:hypothetical protein
MTYQTSCFWPATRAAGLKGSSRLDVADMVRSGVNKSLVGVVRLGINDGRRRDAEEIRIRIPVSGEEPRRERLDGDE